MLVFFPGKMWSDCHKNHDCGQKKTKPEGTSFAIFGVGTAVKYCELKRCACRVRSGTDNKDEDKFYSLNFSPSTKKTTEYSLELFLPIYRYLIYFSQVLNFTSVELNRSAKQAKLKKLFFQKRRWSCDFPPRKMAFSTPSRVELGLPSSSSQSLYGLARVR